MLARRHITLFLLCLAESCEAYQTLYNFTSIEEECLELKGCTTSNKDHVAIASEMRACQAEAPPTCKFQYNLYTEGLYKDEICGSGMAIYTGNLIFNHLGAVRRTWVMDSSATNTIIITRETMAPHDCRYDVYVDPGSCQLTTKSLFKKHLRTNTTQIELPLPDLLPPSDLGGRIILSASGDNKEDCETPFSEYKFADALYEMEFTGRHLTDAALTRHCVTMVFVFIYVIFTQSFL
eukprot:Blabericola_migrator_1__645@NODE_115_length_13846_cov_473_148632_g103_i0_p8_GENE_NODE_115_length_13846_cov_473_148632_g103_i0NODE_115_length_13846_cov_473_148632_g103_i0_p8_ORF_typecomplete_len236_score29_35_NODE_115_length_13846_cov_473_148632_g103_i01203112738